jgi:two-component system, chemotaxis family, chemotaxis protein CheY
VAAAVIDHDSALTLLKREMNTPCQQCWRTFTARRVSMSSRVRCHVHWRNVAMVPQAPLDPDVEAPVMSSMEVLVVDDYDSLHKVMRCALEDAGYSVYEALNGAEALDRLRAHRDGLVVLLDL